MAVKCRARGRTMPAALSPEARTKRHPSFRWSLPILSTNWLYLEFWQAISFSRFCVV